MFCVQYISDKWFVCTSFLFVICSLNGQDWICPEARYSLLLKNFSQASEVALFARTKIKTHANTHTHAHPHTPNHTHTSSERQRAKIVNLRHQLMSLYRGCQIIPMGPNECLSFIHNYIGLEGWG